MAKHFTDTEMLEMMAKTAGESQTRDEHWLNCSRKRTPI